MAAKAKTLKFNMISPDDTVIALMGFTGTGKTTFIDTATRQKGKTIRSTPEIKAVRYPHPVTRRPFVLVDTPGFNNPNKPDPEILNVIATWLEKTYKKKIQLDGIIYLHRITDKNLESSLQYLHMFANICGSEATKNVVLATTMWADVNLQIGRWRERELYGKYWGGILSLGASAMRFEGSFDAAWQIIDQIVNSPGHERRALLLQEELVDLHHRLSRTEAGKTLYTQLQQSLVEQMEMIDKLRNEVGEEQNVYIAKELTVQYEDIQERLELEFGRPKNTKIPLPQRLLMLFSFLHCT